MNHSTPSYFMQNELSTVRSASGSVYNESLSYGSKGFPYHFSGVDNPHWREMILQHVDATTPYTATSVKLLGEKPGFFSGRLTYSPWEFYDQVVDVNTALSALPGSLDHVDTSSADEKARTKFYNKMATSFDAGTFVGELRSTVALIRSPAHALRKAIDVYHAKAYKLRSSVLAEARQEKRRLLRPGTSTLLGNRTQRDAAARAIALKRAELKFSKVSSELILEANLGWRPLMQDIEGAFERLKELLDAPGIERFRASVTEKLTIPRQAVHSTGHFMWNATRYVTEHREVQVQYKGAIYSEKHHDLSFTQKLAVSPGDMIVTGWNLAPWSFLVDYFSNIGDVLNALVLYQRIKYVYCCKTVRVKSRFFAECVSYPSHPQFTVYRNEPNNASIVLRKVNRIPVSAVPIPSLTLELAQSMRHSLNIGALVGARDADKGFKNRVRL